MSVRGITGRRISRLTEFSRLDFPLKYAFENGFFDGVQVFHDVGISSGETAVDAAVFFESAGKKIKIICSDPYSILWKSNVVPFIFVFQRFDGDVAFFEFFKIHVSSKFSFRRPLRKLLGKICENFFKHERNVNSSVKSYFLCDEFMELHNQGSLNFEFVDFLKSPMSGYQSSKSLTRVFNVLNVDLFEQQEIELFIKNVWDSIGPGSLILIGQNFSDKTISWALFKKTYDKFELIHSYGVDLTIYNIIRGFSRESCS